MMKPTIILALLFLFTIKTEAKIYERCEFARHLLQYGIDKNQIGTWSCIAKHESHYNTQAINHATKDYGILQISSIYWCNEGFMPGKGCGITCQSLLGDDIWGDVACAKKVYEETQRLRGNGFSAWTVYGKYCSGNNHHYIAGCF